MNIITDYREFLLSLNSILINDVKNIFRKTIFLTIVLNPLEEKRQRFSHRSFNN